MLDICGGGGEHTNLQTRTTASLMVTSFVWMAQQCEKTNANALGLQLSTLDFTSFPPKGVTDESINKWWEILKQIIT